MKRPQTPSPSLHQIRQNFFMNIHYIHIVFGGGRWESNIPVIECADRDRKYDDKVEDGIGNHE